MTLYKQDALIAQSKDLILMAHNAQTVHRINTLTFRSMNANNV